MHYLQNHCFCRSSNWDDTEYWCRHLVSFTAYEEKSVDDWNALIDPDADEFFSQERYDINKRFASSDVSEETLIKHSFQKSPNLKPHVLGWLNDNVADRPKPDKGQSSKGWCIGSAEYRNTNTNQITIFFHRKSDAMKFIKTFSKWGKPTFYLHYFDDIRKELDLATMKYIDRS